MIPVSIAYQGQLRCVATALGTCMITTIGIKMRNDGVNIDGTRIAVENI